MRHRHLAKLIAAPLLALAAAGRAQVTPLPDEQLADVWGQALLGLTNTSSAGYDFTRITLDSEVDLNARLADLRLGEYTVSNPESREGSGADIDIGLLQLGGATGQTLTLDRPYLEFVYGADGSEVVGMRIGFEGISGAVTTELTALSGDLLIDLGEAGLIDSRNDPLGGRRWDGRSCLETATCPAAYADIERLQAGGPTTPSRDFFLSVLREPVTFPAINGLPSATAQAGFWLNWRDRLSATLKTATAPGS